MPGGSDVVRRRARAFSAERRLAKMLSRVSGSRAFRFPVSGSTSFPDVLLVSNVGAGRVVAFEVKSTVGDRVRVRWEQVRRLLEFVEVFERYGVREAVVAVWFVRHGKWVFRRVGWGAGGDVVVGCDDESDWSPSAPAPREARFDTMVSSTGKVYKP